METIALLGSLTGLGLMAGLSLYATILTVGLGVRFGLVHLDPGLQHLAVLAGTPVLVAAGIVYLFEFFADKIPWLDSIWDSVHTFIRPFGAAVLGVTAIGSVDTVTQVLSVILCGGAALASHSAKAGTRIMVNHSPEPVSNVSLSLFEDGLTFLGTWFSLKHPQLMLIIAGVFMVIILAISPRIFRLLKVELLAFHAMIDKYLSGSGRLPAGEPMPDGYEQYLRKRFDPSAFPKAVRCVASRGVGGLRHSVGYLCLGGEGLFFLTRRWFHFSLWQMKGNSITDLRRTKGLLLDLISFSDGEGPRSFYFFKNRSDRGMQALVMMQDQSPTKDVT
ncbi:MAG TPA: DUF4126 domain-containing protein [Syntrophorhabdaceae bacterium]|jgi:hypothetical protein